MLLTIDIGNTHTVLGIYQGESLLAHWRLTSANSKTEDEVFALFAFFCEQKNIDIRKIDGIIISSVVPEQTPVYARMGENYFSIKPFDVSAHLDTGLKILYDNPFAVGADRICNAVAGLHKYGGPIVVVDFGTATTFDCVSANAEYLGGLIMPGIETASIDLHKRAAKLPKVDLTFPDKLIATNTSDSMRAGIMFSAVDGVDGILRRLKKEMGEKTKIVGTGGLAHVIVEKSELLKIVEPHMVLEGLRLIYERVKK
ncbi:type III pantothenate kinase [bacterium]|nr:type III pantothenate kinase [bacterium]